MSGVFQIESTVDSREAGQSLADALVERRLAACVQVAGPISSTYRWQGELRHDDEVETGSRPYLDWVAEG